MSVRRRRERAPGAILPDSRIRVRTHVDPFGGVTHSTRRGPERAEVEHRGAESCDVCFLAGYVPGTQP